MARGFASMSEERRWEVASRGGTSTQRRGTGHLWTPEEARKAGRKGAERRAALADARRQATRSSRGRA